MLMVLQPILGKKAGLASMHLYKIDAGNFKGNW